MNRKAYLAFVKLFAICGSLVIAGTPIMIALLVDVLISRILGVSNLSEAFDIQVTSWWRLLIFYYIQYLVVTLIISVTHNTSKVLYKHRDLFLL